MMYDIHTGYFVSRDDTRWTVTIQQDMEGAPDSVGNLEFPDEEPLVIEWFETPKEGVICGSTATLKILSPGDRTYMDLYTIKAGDIGIKIEREGLLYWMGTLDPELYEEPYTDNEDYEVELTFSDFGIFERLQYNLNGLQSLWSVLADALSRAHINETVNQNWISSQLTAGSGKMSLNDLSVRSDNFTDEDGDTDDMKKVIEGILQPLGLRIIQRNGKVYVYDLNGIFQSAPTRKINWHDDDQTMGADRVVNNIKITLSPYSSSKLLDGEVEFAGEYSVDRVNLTAPVSDYYSYYPLLQQRGHMDYDLINFTIFLSSKGKGLAFVNNAAKYFHILPVLGGPSECEGIAWGFDFSKHVVDNTSIRTQTVRILNSIGKIANQEVMRTNRVYLPKLQAGARSGYRLRLTLEMLLDPRYNPFTSADEGNEKENYNDTKVWTGWAFVPFSATVYDRGGNPLCHYENKDTARSGTEGKVWNNTGEWVAGGGNFGDAYLEYYDTEDQKEDTGIMGWKANRHCIGRPDHQSRPGYEMYIPIIPKLGKSVIYDSFRQLDDGEYMPYPPDGGYMEVSVYAGVNCYDWGEDTDFDTTHMWDEEGLYDKMKWLLYKAPTVEVVRANHAFTPEDIEDVEYGGVINANAKENISIDTVCGTIDKTAPTAKGLYFLSSDGLQLSQLTRQGRTDKIERLLIGTMYSQFADRHVRLAGTAFLMDGDLRLYTDGSQGDRKFIVLSDIQDLNAGTSEISAVQLSPDEYAPIIED